jgi:hypothetical protein
MYLNFRIELYNIFFGMPSGKEVKKAGYGILALGLVGLACAIFISNDRLSRDLFRLSIGTGALATSVITLGKALE